MTTGARVLWLVSVAVLVGCAAAGVPSEGHDAAVTHHDGGLPPIDAPKGVIDASLIDGPLPIDAAPPDAAGEPLICTANAQCTNAGDCCFTLGQPDGICVPGTIFLGACIPN